MYISYVNVNDQASENFLKALQIQALSDLVKFRKKK